MMDAHNWTTLRTVDGVDVRIRRLGSGSGSDGSYHVNDRVELQIDNRDRRPDDSYHVVALGERWDVEIGGHEAPRIEPPVRDDWDAYRSIRIPNTVETGRQTVTVDGVEIGTIRVYNPDYPLADSGESDSESAEVPGTTQQKQPAETDSTDSEQSADSESAEVPGTTQQEQPTETDGTQSSEQSGIDTTKAAAAAGIAALALLIWAR